MSILRISKRDGPRYTISTPCDHCKTYCVRASIKMINAFFGGTISQDRISFHLCEEAESGYDTGRLSLGHGLGTHFEPYYVSTGGQPPFSWSLGIGETDVVSSSSSPPYSWQFIADAIVEQTPVLVGWDSPHHAVVVCGVRINAGVKQVLVADPWWPATDSKAISWQDESVFASHGVVGLYRVADAKWGDARENARHDETTIGTVQADASGELCFVPTDTDGDGVVDFDETDARRFDQVNGVDLDPNLPDTDTTDTCPDDGAFCWEHLVY